MPNMNSNFEWYSMSFSST